MSKCSILIRAVLTVVTVAAFSGVILRTTPSEAQGTCQTHCSNSNATCMAGSCRCSPGGNGFCAPPYPLPVPASSPLNCNAPTHVQVCDGAKLCCGPGFGMCVDGNHPMCVR
jgi:hypothetical protein